jgi:hypothetical protein
MAQADKSIEMRLAALTATAAHVGTPQQVKSLIDECFKLADDASDSEDFDSARQAMQLADRRVALAKDPALQIQVHDRLDKASLEAHDAAGVRSAEKLLARDPSDPAANAIVGRYRCFTRLDWKRGLPLLAKCDDRSLQLAATIESGMNGASQTTSAELHRAADAWWDAAQKEKNAPRGIELSRCLRFYEAAYEDSNGAERERADSRITQIVNALADYGVAYRDDPQALAALLGPKGAAQADIFSFQKFSIRTDNAGLKRIYGLLQLSADHDPSSADHMQFRLRALCYDQHGAPHVLEAIHPLHVHEIGQSTIRLTGPDVEAIKAINDGAWCPRDAHLAIFIDKVMIWQQVWQTPQKSAWWMDEKLVVR